MVDDEHDSSFDPRTWLRPQGASPPPPPPPPPAPEKPDAISPFGDRRQLIGVGLSVLILCTGGLTAALSHKKTVKIPAGASATAAPTADTAAATAPPGSATRIMTISSLNDLVPALSASGLPDAEAQKAAQAALATITPGKTGDIRLTIVLDKADKTTQLVTANIAYGDSSGAVVTRASDGSYTAKSAAAVLQTVMVVKRGEMDTNSFYSSAVTAGITDSLIPDFANAFSYDFDFQREIVPGDVFEAAFEQQQNAAGEPVGAPHLVYASLSTAQKSKALYYFKPATGDAGWFDGNGQSVVRSFLRTPIDGAHITSAFGMRVHPVLGFEAMHKGTDFGAPIGTPIYAAGDGKVEWAAMKGPNGNIVIIDHANGWKTFYLHMSKFGDGIVPGIDVHQGETIGYVGTTGRSTGPHLHFEMHDTTNTPVDSMTVPLESGHSLAGADLTGFFKERDRIDTMRAAQAQ